MIYYRYQEEKKCITLRPYSSDLHPSALFFIDEPPPVTVPPVPAETLIIQNSDPPVEPGTVSSETERFYGLPLSL